MGIDEERGDALVHQIVRDWRRAGLSSPDHALCDFAARLTHTPGRMDEGALDTLRSHGFDDRAIHDATQVIAYFNYITRVAEALGVEPEDFIRPWGATGGDSPSDADPVIEGDAS